MPFKKLLTLFLVAVVFLPFVGWAFPLPPGGGPPGSGEPPGGGDPPPLYEGGQLPLEGIFEEIPTRLPGGEGEEYTPPVDYGDIEPPCLSPEELQRRIAKAEERLQQLKDRYISAFDEFEDLVPQLEPTQSAANAAGREILKLEEDRRRLILKGAGLTDPAILLLDEDIRNARITFKSAVNRLIEVKRALQEAGKNLSALRMGIRGLESTLEYLREQLNRATSFFCRIFNRPNRNGLVRFPWPQTKKPLLGEFLVELDFTPQPPLNIGGIIGGAMLVVPIFVEDIVTAPTPAWRCLGWWGRLFCTPEEMVAAEYQKWIETGCSDRLVGYTECVKEAMNRYYAWKKYLEENSLPHTNIDIGKLERAYQEVLAAMEENSIGLVDAIKRDFTKIYGSLLNFFGR